MLQDFHEEYAKVAFKRYDPEGTGFISALDFNDIILSVKSHLLTPDVKANLIAVTGRLIFYFVCKDLCKDVGSLVGRQRRFRIRLQGVVRLLCGLHLPPEQHGAHQEDVPPSHIEQD